MVRKPAQVFHPAEFIQGELSERGWSTQYLAELIGGDVAVNLLALDLYMVVRDPDVRLGSLASELSRAFGVSEQYFANLERAYLAGAST